jgi:hypothetical protein
MLALLTLIAMRGHPYTFVALKVASIGKLHTQACSLALLFLAI